MRFTLENNTEMNVVRAYGPGEISVRDQVITRSLILTASELVADWAPQTIDAVTELDMRRVLTHDPEVIVLGTGESLVFPHKNIMTFVLQRGVGLEVMDTPAACRTYNVLVHEGRRVAAALLQT